MRTIFLSIVTGFVCFAVGCESHETAEPAPVLAASPLPSPTPDRQDVFNLQKLQNVPPEARAAFERDYPGVGVSSVELNPSSTGPMLYKIAFIRDGKPGTVIYDAKGAVIAPPAPPEQLRTPRPGFPPENPGPTNNP